MPPEKRNYRVRLCGYTYSSITRVNGILCGIRQYILGTCRASSAPELFFWCGQLHCQLRSSAGKGFSKWCPGGELLKDFDLSQGSYTRDIAHVRHSVEAAIDSHVAFLNPELLYMRSVDIQITERCSMKCLDCSNLMHLYQHPINFDSDDIKSWVDGFCRNIDRVGEARVIGGEPFMNKNAAELVRHCAEKPQFQRVTIFTNGTISLTQKQLDLMRHPKVVFLITPATRVEKKHESIPSALNQRYSLRVAEGQWLDRLRAYPTPAEPGRSKRRRSSSNLLRQQAVHDFAGQFVPLFVKPMLWA